MKLTNAYIILFVLAIGYIAYGISILRKVKCKKNTVIKRFGVVHDPGEKPEVRRQKESMGENFIMWAEEYFSDEKHLNRRIYGKLMYDDFFHQSAIKDRKYITPRSFKYKIKIFCEWKGYVLNPQMYDPLTHLPKKVDEKTDDPITDDKWEGAEWFTIGEPKKFFTF